MQETFNNDTFRTNLLNFLNINSYEHLNKAKFAESIGIQPDTIQKLTSGATQNPGIKTIVALADKLGCSIDDLVGYTPKNKGITNIVSSELKMNKVLFQSTINYIFTFIENNKIEPLTGQIINVLDNIYDYSFRRKLDYPDPEFSDWKIKSAFKV